MPAWGLRIWLCRLPCPSPGIHSAGRWHRASLLHTPLEPGLWLLQMPVGEGGFLSLLMSFQYLLNGSTLNLLGKEKIFKETIYRVRAPAGQSQTPARSQAPVPANPQHPPRRGWWHQETPGQPPPEPSDLSFKDGVRQGVLNPSRTHCCPRGARYWTWQFLPGEAPSAPRRAQGPLWGSWQPSCSRGRLSRHGPHGRAEW